MFYPVGANTYSFIVHSLTKWTQLSGSLMKKSFREERRRLAISCLRLLRETSHVNCHDLWSRHDCTYLCIANMSQEEDPLLSTNHHNMKERMMERLRGGQKGEEMEIHERMLTVTDLNFCPEWIWKRILSTSALHLSSFSKIEKSD